jgi:methyl-accepting chemotaxis protein
MTNVIWAANLLAFQSWDGVMKFSSIKFKIGLILAILFVLVLAVSLAGLINIQNVGGAVEIIHGDTLPNINAADAMNSSLAQLRAAEASFIVTTNKAGQDDAAKSIAEAAAIWSTNYTFYLGLIDPAHVDEHAAFVKIGDDYQHYLALEKTALDLGAQGKMADALKIYTSTMADLYKSERAAVYAMVETNKGEADDAYADSQTVYSHANLITLVFCLFSLVLVLASAIFVIRSVINPVSNLIKVMQALTAGNIDSEIRYQERKDEIGEMSRAMNVFVAGIRARMQLETDAERLRLAAEEERNAAEKQSQDTARQISHIVDTLAENLEKLAQGDLSTEIQTPFGGQFDKLRTDYNKSVAGLRQTLGEIRDISSQIHAAGANMTSASSDLAERTDRQAVALDQAVVTVDRINATMRDSAERAAQTRKIVAGAKDNADGSAKVVQNAISSMGRIKEASEKISQIVGVIDSIAFQTNLLALNAGVEAARAGDAGKGFAVVAQEVRELAQRSASAAKEIGQLISNSTNEVAVGAQHVEATGNVLMEISGQIVEISDQIGKIAVSSREQSVSLDEVKTSVDQLERIAQSNKSMVNQSNLATTQLASDASTLRKLIARFLLTDTRQEDHRRAAA